MESLIAFTGTDFVLCLGSTGRARGIMMLVNDQDKLHEVHGNIIALTDDGSGDGAQFLEYIKANINLTTFRNSLELSTHETSNFIRSEIARSLRKDPKSVNCLIAGIDKEKPSLYWIDYLGTLVKLEKAAHGYASKFCSSVLDRRCHENLTLDEGLTIVRECIQVLETRFLVNAPNFICKIITKDGIQIIDLNE
ncbi:hypothetical protein PCE1_002237 [Barthelona sp. PCE]